MGGVVGEFTGIGGGRKNEQAETAVCDGKTLKFVYDAADYRPTQCSCWFYKYENLATIQGLANLNTSKATSLAYMFFDCWSLTSLDLTGFGTANVTDMDCMFYSCGALASLDLSVFDTAKVTDMDYMFAGCSSLTSLDVTGFDTSKVTDMSCMFYGCSSLEAICVSDRFVTTAVSDGSYMFLGCTSLVGDAGTKYDSTKTDATYARIDGGPSAPGYFTRGAGVYKIRFAANGGAGTMADQICVKGKTYNIRKCALTAPSGKTFAGWRSSKNGKLYADGILVFGLAEPGETVTMTAVWK